MKRVNKWPAKSIVKEPRSITFQLLQNGVRGQFTGEEIITWAQKSWWSTDESCSLENPEPPQTLQEAKAWLTKTGLVTFEDMPPNTPALTVKEVKKLTNKLRRKAYNDALDDAIKWARELEQHAEKRDDRNQFRERAFLLEDLKDQDG